MAPGGYPGVCCFIVKASRRPVTFSVVQNAVAQPDRFPYALRKDEIQVVKKAGR